MEQVFQDLYKRLGYSYNPRSMFTGYITSDNKLHPTFSTSLTLLHEKILSNFTRDYIKI